MQEIEIGRIMALGQLNQKSSQDPISAEKKMIVVCTCHPNTARMCKIVSQFRQTCAKQ
jgi:hypothetical protein